MNTELLKNLYSVFSPSGSTKKMRRFLKRQITLRGGMYIQDAAGNILVTKGAADEYPCLASHIDQVSHHTHPKDFRCIESEDIIMGWSDKLKQQCGLGADDKNGVFICLNALEKFDVLKVAFFVDEEIGCVGSSHVDMSFFDNCRFVIEPDRRNGTDFISSMSGAQVCSDEFCKDSGFERYGYEPEEGSVTDVLTLLDRGLDISCLNLSCGYYHPHTDEEVTVISELENCQNLVFHMVETMRRRYPYTPQYSFYGDYIADMDYDIMESVIETNRDISFDEIMSYYGNQFSCKDRKYLAELYNDIRNYYDDFGYTDIGA